MKLDDYKNDAELLPKLISAGLTEDAAQNKLKPFRHSCDALLEAGLAGQRQVRGFFIPGRIEVLGKHTDYCGGRSIVAAADKGFCLIAVPRTNSRLNIFAAEMSDNTEFDIDVDLQPTLGHWSNYPMTVARRVARNFPGELHGADIAFASDLPVAAGMSSSSALMVSIFKVLSAINQLDQRSEYQSNIKGSESLAGYLGTVENGQSFGPLEGDKGVGTFGGSEDHTAMLCGKAHRLSQYSYCPVQLEKYIDMPQDHVFVIASSGIKAEKTGAALEKYNRATKLASAIIKAWNQHTNRADQFLAAILKSDPDALNKIRDILKTADVDDFPPEELSRRWEHFYIENEQIIPAAGAALATGDLETFGQQVDKSQELTDTFLGNQVQETIYLAQTARKLGAIAASAFGAGFGGSVWAMTSNENAETLLIDWADQYHKTYRQHAGNSSFFIGHAGPSAFEI
ncbi:MAG: galactokinase [Planctomycetes bacterium]|nr:galactokinase [Planctomycetota bacterium]